MAIQSVLVALLGVAIAGGSAYGAKEYLNTQSITATADPQAELTTVIVASQDIPFGVPIEPQMLSTAPWPRNAIPMGAYVNASGLLPASGQQPRRTKYAMAQGEVVLTSQVSGFGEKVTLVQTLGPNSRAMAIQVDAVTAVGGFVTPGDKVDVILTQGSGDAMRTVTILQDIRVLGVDQDANSQNDKAAIAKTVTVEVSPEQGQTLALAQKAGSLSLSLRTLDGVIDTPLDYTSIGDLMHDKSPTPVSGTKRTVTVRRANVVEVVEINN